MTADPHQQLLGSARVSAQRIQHRPRIRAGLISERGNQHVGCIRQDAIHLRDAKGLSAVRKHFRE